MPIDYDLAQRWSAVNGSAAELLQALNRTLEFIEPDIIFEAFRPGEPPAAPVTAVSDEPKPYIVPELDAAGYAVGEHGRSDRIRRGILRRFSPEQACAMLEKMIGLNADPAVLADLSADLHFIHKQQQEGL